MKKCILYLISVVLLFTACNKEEETEITEDDFVPDQEQWGIAINYTATWCGPCGTWGAPLIHDLSNAGNVVAITVHAADDPMFISSLYTSFDADRPTGDGIPSFWIGDKKSNSVAYMETLLQETAIAGINIESSKNDSFMKVTTKTQFSAAVSGRFYLSVLILEDGIDGSESAGDYEQNGVLNPSTYSHDFVLRASSISNNAFGEEIVVSPEKGTIVEKEYEIALDPGWDQHVYPVAILWQLNLNSNPQYKFINAIK